MTDVLIEPAPGQRRAFARWCLEQTPKIPTATASGSFVPLELLTAVPDDVLAGARIDGTLFRPVIEGFEPDGPGYRPVARLLDCGLCYEENGEEVHPHPDCTFAPAPGEQNMAGLIIEPVDVVPVQDGPKPEPVKAPLPRRRTRSPRKDTEK
jgi:hypothetical protein